MPKRWEAGLLSFVAAASWASCAEKQPGTRSESLRSPIVGGQVETGWDGVGALVHTGMDGTPYDAYCTAVLVAPRWILTAGHCIDAGGGAPVAPTTIRFFLGNSIFPPETVESEPGDEPGDAGPFVDAGTGESAGDGGTGDGGTGDGTGEGGAADCGWGIADCGLQDDLGTADADAGALDAGSSFVPGVVYSADLVVLHPTYNPVFHFDDLGLIRLGKEAAATVYPLRFEPLTVQHIGAEVLYIGFGQDPFAAAGLAGVKRSGLMAISEIVSNVYFSAFAGQGVCFGDSGAPGFLPGPDGTWEIAGISSGFVEGAGQGCASEAVHSRADFYRAWIEEVIAESALPEASADSCATDVLATDAAAEMIMGETTASDVPAAEAVEAPSVADAAGNDSTETGRPGADFWPATQDKASGDEGIGDKGIGDEDCAALDASPAHGSGSRGCAVQPRRLPGPWSAWLAVAAIAVLFLRRGRRSGG